jgi:hypothetical protein
MYYAAISSRVSAVRHRPLALKKVCKYIFFIQVFGSNVFQYISERLK